LKYDYNLSPEEYETLIGKGCAICGETKDLHIDHNHATGAVRAALCAKHNKGLGHFEDNPEYLRKAADYLECHGG
jgi:Recombination endonuclease VII